jgi:hypothetical protein
MVVSDEISKWQPGFRSLPELVAGLPALGAVMTADGTAATLKGYHLRLIVSGDKRHFQVSLTPDRGCGTSWFASDLSVAYVGRPLGCGTN